MARAGTERGMRVILALVALVALPPATKRCATVTTLDGPLDLIAQIERGLRAHGLEIGTSGACSGRIVRAHITRGGRGSFHLHIDDGYGRTSDRVLSEPETAVSLIESWAVDEDADLTTTRVSPPPVPLDADIATRDSGDTKAGAVWLYGGLSSAIGSDRSLWGGTFAGGCSPFGRACVGAEVAAAYDLGVLGDTADGGISRLGADLMLIGGLPLAHGRWRAMPRLGLGAGWLRTSVAAEDFNMPAQTRNTLGFRGALGVLAGVAISQSVALAIDLDAVFAPWAERSPDGFATSSLPAEPRLSGRAAIACVVTP